MKIQEEMGNLPVWKVVIIFLLAISLLFFVVEELFIGRIFSVLNKGITHFEKIAKEEKDEIDRDYDEFDEKEAYDHAMYEINGMMMNNYQFIDKPRYMRTCNVLLMQKKLEKLYELPFVKKRDYVQGLLASRINLIKKEIDSEIEKYHFDPDKCDGIS